jgi:phenylacetate-CoA ligase
MPDYFDALETRRPEAREAALMAALPAQIARAKERAPGFARILAGVDPQAVSGRAALARVPLTRKSSLIELQTAAPPFGGLAATETSALAHLYLSPGPICAPEGAGADWWRVARAVFAAGFRKGDVVHNCFSYHLTPGGLMFDAAARAVGCAVIPGGVGQSDQQAWAMARYRADGYAGTPDFLKVILDKAAEIGADVSSCRKAIVSGGALPRDLRETYAARGVRVAQCYVTADLGLVAYESEARDGLIVAEDVIVEIVRPGTGDPLPAGEVGEVVVTTLCPDYPLIRFATGDLSAVLPGASPCGRTNMRVKGWMGRADQTTKVKGMFVHPSQVAEVLRRHPELLKGRLVVERLADQDRMTLRCEVGGAAAGLAETVSATLQDVLRLKGEVELMRPGSLPNDGKVIEDARTYA